MKTEKTKIPLFSEQHKELIDSVLKEVDKRRSKYFTP